VKLSLFKEKISVPIYAIKLKHSLNEEVREAFLRLL